MTGDSDPMQLQANSAMTALLMILKGKPSAGDRGEFPCPKCGAQFVWVYHGPRAIRGACVTPNCLGLMS